MTPKLRFPGFTGEWQVKKLGDITHKVGSGSTPRGGTKVYKKSGVPFIRSQNVVNGRLNLADVAYIDRTVHNLMSNSAIRPNDVLLNITGASLGRTCVVPSDFIEGNLNQHVCIIRPNKEAHSFIVHTILSLPRSLNALLKSQTGGGKEGLNFQAVRSFRVALPSPEEQEKIAGFLTTIDKRIELQEKRVELLKKYKQGIMQKIFSQKIRFKDNNDNDYPEWSNVSLGKVFERVTRKNHENNTNVLTISGLMGLVNQFEYYNHSYASNNLIGYTLIRNGEFAYNKSYSTGYPMGAIKMLERYDSGVVSPLYICFRIIGGNSGLFFKHYFESGIQNKEIAKIAQEGARNHGLLNVSAADFFGGVVLQVPISEEQQKIADLLSSLDDKIELENKKLQKAKLFKKSLLQRMFA